MASYFMASINASTAKWRRITVGHLIATCLVLLLATATPVHARDDCDVAAVVVSVVRDHDAGVSLPASVMHMEMLFHLEGLLIPDDGIPDMVNFIFHSRATRAEAQAYRRRACAQDERNMATPAFSTKERR